MPGINYVEPALGSPCVPPHYVHKRNPDEVLLTSWTRPCPDTFVVSARWPTRHSFYRTWGGLHDSMLFVESVRQCFPLLSHAGYGTPFGHHLVWHYLNYEVAPAALRDTGEPAELDLHISCTDNRRRNLPPTALTLHIVAVRDGVHLGTAQARFSCHSPAIYRRLRGSYSDLPAAVAAAGTPPAPVSPTRVGRASAADVVLSPTGQFGRWRLRNDTSHPILFDHPVDHSPGMLLLEAARQAARAACPDEARYPVRVESSFLQFTEFDAPCLITVEPLPYDGRHQTRIVASQGNENTFSATVTAIAEV